MRSGTERRFNDLYDRYFREVLAYCLRRAPSADGYDAANEVFAIAWRRIEDVPDGDAAVPWLFVVAKRVLYRRWRSTHRFRRLTSRGVLQPGPGVPDPETVVVQQAEYDMVIEATSRLRPIDREVLYLAAWEGMPHRQIAEVLGCSIAAVDQRLYRAKNRLAKQFDALSKGFAREAMGGEPR